jgi:putative toxin-antitoxin system antitoxin component (TIGR02293 family)
MAKTNVIRRAKRRQKGEIRSFQPFPPRTGEKSQVDAFFDAGGKIVAIDYRKSGDSIGVRCGSNLEAVKVVEAGLPFKSIRRFRQTSGLTLDRIKQVTGISEGSYNRRKRTGRLSQEESERLFRVGRLFERATGLYDGDQDGARQWLETSVPALGNQRPLDLARTEPGAREVEDLIGRIEHGVVS